MRKAERLNDIVHHLRRMHHAITAQTLADAFDKPSYHLPRHSRSHRFWRAHIGEAGVHIIDKKYHLPPIMFDADELEAIALGIGMVSNWTDDKFMAKAKSAYLKIQATLPATLLNELHQISTFSAPSHYKIPWQEFTEVRNVFAVNREWVLPILI